MITVKIPASIIYPISPLIEIGIIENMTVDRVRGYDEDGDFHIFRFNDMDISLVRRVLTRMFGQTHSQIIYEL